MNLDYTQKDVARFWSKVDCTAGLFECWVWRTRAASGDYGKFHLNGREWYAHCVSYLFAFGAYPESLYVLHKCDNRPCVNPSHLFLGTYLDNVRDMMQKGRKRYMYGEELPQTKVTDAQVEEIRRRFASGDGGLRSLGNEYHISPSTI